MNILQKSESTMCFVFENTHFLAIFFHTFSFVKTLTRTKISTDVLSDC